MAGKEEGSMDAAKWTLMPCTAGKSEKDAVAGDEGPVMRCHTERKKVPESSYKEGDQPPKGWKPASFGPFGLQRRAAALDKMLGAAKLPVASVVSKKAAATPAAAAGGGSKSKRRLTKSEIQSIIALKPEPFPSDDYPEGLVDFFPPEWIEEKRRQREDLVAVCQKIDKDHEAFRQQVIRGLKEDGYYEVDEDYLEAREKASDTKHHVWKPFANLDPAERNLRVSTPEEERLWGYRGYVPDEEDDLLISRGDDDFRSDDDFLSDEGDAEVEGAHVHKRHPIQSN